MLHFAHGYLAQSFFSAHSNQREDEYGGSARSAETGLSALTSWFISDPKQANDLIQSGQVDLVMLARPLLADPHWPYASAKALGIENPAWATLPPPYAHWLARYRVS